MKTAAIPTNEEQRLAELRGFHILDTQGEAALDDLTRIASLICGTPIALISLVDEHRQWFKSRVGLTASETPRDVAFCSHAILGNSIFVVPDATQDDRFRDNPLVTNAPNVCFYAGAPLITAAGLTVGTLCVIDHHPRNLSSWQKDALAVLARQVVMHLELRRAITGQKESEALLHSTAARFSSMVNEVTEVIFQTDSQTNWTFLNPAWEAITGYTVQESLGTALSSCIHPDDRARFAELLRPLLEGKQPRFRNEIRFCGKFGQEIWVEIYARPTVDETGKRLGLAGTVTDVNTRKKNRTRTLGRRRV